MNFSVLLRAVALACFIIACAGGSFFGISPIAFGLAAWVGSTFA